MAFHVTCIETGSFLADGGAMFGAIPKRAWKRKYKEVEDNLCIMAMRCLLVQSETQNILVDLAMGDKHLKEIEYYRPFDLVDIPDCLNEFNLKPEDITDVVLTHLHFDHCGYATIYDSEKRAIPTFENAKYWVSEKQWLNFQYPCLLENDSFFEDDMMPIMNNNKLHLISKNTILSDGFELQLYDGHTHGQIVPIINTEKGIVAFPSDLVPTSAHVSLEWISAYDLSAEISLKEKIRFLSDAVDKDYTLIYYHDAYISKSKVKRLNDNFVSCDKHSNT